MSTARIEYDMHLRKVAGPEVLFSEWPRGDLLIHGSRDWAMDQSDWYALGRPVDLRVIVEIP